MGKLYAVGDIHGRLDMLEALLPKVLFRPEDRIVFIGDYVDRGPDSQGVVERVLAFKREFPGAVFLRGNHEDMLLDLLDGTRRYQPGIYFLNGGVSTFRSYGLDPLDHPPRFPREHVDFFRSLLLFHREDPFLFVHAGLRPGVALSKQDPMDLLWIREEFFGETHDFGYTVVFGHTPLQEVFDNSPHAIGIDTGAAYGNKLTCVELAEGRILATYQVKASEVG